MKEIKAFVRQNRISEVLQALRDSGFCDLSSTSAGCHNLTISQVQRPFAGANPDQQHYSMELAEAVVAEYKLELTCADDLADSLTAIIAQAAHTGQAEAGWIIVCAVEKTVKVTRPLVGVARYVVRVAAATHRKPTEASRGAEKMNFQH